MRRLVASGLLPERAGQPVKLWGHVSLAELRALDDGSVLQDQWIGEMTVRWAARRAAASQTGSDGAAWLDGISAGAMACDAPAAQTAVIALWLGHAEFRSTNGYLHADMAIKQRALDLITPTSAPPARTLPSRRPTAGLPGKPVTMPITATPATPRSPLHQARSRQAVSDSA
jgi:hypothetical protein